MSLYKGKFLNVIQDDVGKYFKLSVSKTKVFKDCNAKYFFQYIKKLPRKEWQHSIFGSFIHEVLERFENELLIGSKISAKKLLIICYKNALSGIPFKVFFGPKSENYKESYQKNSEFRIWENSVSSEQKIEFIKILNDFLEKREAKIISGTLPSVIETEKPFNIDIDGTILLNGYIDLLKRDPDGVLHVADYKTSSSDKYLKKDVLQLKTYAYALCLEDPTLEVIRCSYIMVKLGFSELIFEFTRDEIMKCEEEYLKVSEKILEETLFRPTTGPLCEYCDFLDECSSGKEKVEMLKAIKEKKNKKLSYQVENSTFGETSW